MKPPLSPSYKFEKEEEGGEGLEEEEGEAAPLAVIPGSATAWGSRNFKNRTTVKLLDRLYTSTCDILYKHYYREHLAITVAGALGDLFVASAYINAELGYL